MSIIKWEDANSLCDHLYELLVLTYLQGQILCCSDLAVFDEGGLRISQKDGAEYLWDRQRDVLQVIKHLIEKEDFIVKENNADKATPD